MLGDSVQAKLDALVKPLLGNVMVFPPLVAEAVPIMMCGLDNVLTVSEATELPVPVRWAILPVAPGENVPEPVFV